MVLVVGGNGLLLYVSRTLESSQGPESLSGTEKVYLCVGVPRKRGNPR